MTYRLQYTQRAYDDISRNADWWAENHSSEQASRWFDAIDAKINSLTDFPDSYSLAYEDPDYAHELREAYFGLGSRPGYRILFTVIDYTVYVLSVRAAEQDWLKPGELPTPDDRE